MIYINESLEKLKENIDVWLKTRNNESKLSKQRIFIKPNMGYPKPAPYTTALDIIKTTIDVLSKYSPKEIIIAEGTTSNYSALDIFVKNGLVKELEEYNVTFMDLNQQPSEVVSTKIDGKHFLPNILNNTDIRISMPVIKFYNDDEGKLFLSNAIKNFFGLPPKDKYKSDKQSFKRDSLHKNLHRSVAGIYQAVENFSPFDLYICDGRIALLGEANIGEPIEWGKIIVGDNAVEIDLKVLEILKKPMPRYLEILVEKGGLLN
ncbi:MAG: DUF362 domain-containing protein [Candidatus Heimdallarchaeota archaeon]|nr:DUF362 domain-containing protein [Candidatus Heimdallarchaeota archaeon]